MMKRDALQRYAEPSAAASQASSQGFTLIELLVTMVIAMVILGGLLSNFLLQSRVQARQASTVNVLEDMRLVSQIMTSQLRVAQNICWDAADNMIIYQPLGATTMTAAACNPSSMSSDWGAFQYTTGSTATGGTMRWYRPNVSGYAQMMQGLSTSNGLQISTATASNSDLGILRSLTLNGQYETTARTKKTLSIGFDVLPRNH